MSSILNDVKHALGLLPAGNAFDSDIIMHINTQFFNLRQLGVSPNAVFRITGPNEEWEALDEDYRLDAIKSYIFLRVKLLLDPPQVGFVISSMDRQIDELAFRILCEADKPIVGPTPTVDGGEF